MWLSFGIGLALLAVGTELVTGSGRFVVHEGSNILLASRNFLFGVLIVGFRVGNCSGLGTGDGKTFSVLLVCFFLVWSGFWPRVGNLSRDGLGFWVGNG